MDAFEAQSRVVVDFGGWLCDVDSLPDASWVAEMDVSLVVVNEEDKDGSRREGVTKLDAMPEMGL